MLCRYKSIALLNLIYLVIYSLHDIFNIKIHSLFPASMALDTIFKGKPSILISAWEIYQYIHCIQDTCIKKPTYY